MEYGITTLETLKLNSQHLETAIQEEFNEGYVWKNLIRIEKIKREKKREKDNILRNRIQNRCNPI